MNNQFQIRNFLIVLMALLFLMLIIQVEMIGVNKRPIDEYNVKSINCSSMKYSGKLCKFKVIISEGIVVKGYSGSCFSKEQDNMILFKGKRFITREDRYYLTCN